MTGLAYGEMARRFGGAPGSVLELVLARDGEPVLRSLHLVRAALRSDTVSTRAVGRNLAWIRISSFGSSTAAELATALHTLDARGAPDGLILDLRNDPGGLVNAAAGVASAFLAPEQALFLVRGRGAEERIDVSMGRAAPQAAGIDGALPAWTRTVPLVVLVNGASASAAELLAGCAAGSRTSHGGGQPHFRQGIDPDRHSAHGRQRRQNDGGALCDAAGTRDSGAGTGPRCGGGRGGGPNRCCARPIWPTICLSAGRDTGGAYHGGGCEAVRQRAGQGPADGHCVPAAAGGAAQRD
ncbi:hypothetical protein LP419_35540 [Massilia sp. H-1]|nr:hypothetical protein LP419_35540 [Massilia sp. H-1]